jgi:hypothetical protein
MIRPEAYAEAVSLRIDVQTGPRKQAIIAHYPSNNCPLPEHMISLFIEPIRALRHIQPLHANHAYKKWVPLAYAYGFENREIEPFVLYRAIELFQIGVLVRLAELDKSQLYLPVFGSTTIIGNNGNKRY